MTDKVIKSTDLHDANRQKLFTTCVKKSITKGWFSLATESELGVVIRSVELMI